MKPRSDATTPATARLRVDDVTVQLGGRTILDGVSLEVPAGQVVGLVGPNGAGKTTLLDVICGATTPGHGSVHFDDKPLRAVPRKLTRLGIARTQQNPGPIEESTVLEHVIAGASQPARTGFGTLLQAVSRDEEGDARQLAERVLQLFKELGLSGTKDADPASLPYAMRQRVALARALITNPRLLLLDEPAGGLSTDESRELGQLLSALVSRPGRDCAVLLVEHHVEMVLECCDALVVLDEGRVIAHGAPEHVGSDPAVVETYFGVEPGTS